jgi:uncharacterized membrane protein YkoI
MRASIGFLLCLGLSCPVAAGEQEEIRRAVEAGALRPLAEILADVQARHPGRVLDVELERRGDGTRFYEIEVLGADGRTVEILVDARSGVPLDRRGAGSAALQPLSRLLREVLERHPGQVIDVDLDRDHYDIQIAPASGGLRRVRIDAVSGRIEDHASGRADWDRVLSLPEILEGIAREHPGTVVEVELERGGAGNPEYEFDLLDDRGRILELRVDAVSGRILADDRP